MLMPKDAIAFENIERRKVDYLAFDIENEPKTGEFICSHIYGYYKTKGLKNKVLIDYHFTDLKAFQDFVMKVTNEAYYKIKLVAFNLNYDEFTLRDILDDARSVRTKSYIVKLVLKNGVEVFDIQNVTGLMYSLEYWINTLEMEKLYGIKKESLKLIHERNRFDAMATYQLVIWVEDYLLRYCGIKLNETIGMNAMDFFKSRFLNYPIIRKCYKCVLMDNYFNKGVGQKCDKLVCPNTCKWYMPDMKCEKKEKCPKLDCPYLDKEYDCSKYIQNPLFNKVDNLERQSYYGGRVEIFKRGIIKVDSFDVHSMYVSVMRDSIVPIPDKYVYIANPKPESFKHIYDNYYCIITCTVNVPYQYICPLPYRTIIDKSPKIIYPYGIFSGTWTSIELKNAEKYGVTISNIKEIIYYYNKDGLFNEYAKFIWEKRELHNTLCLNKLKKTCKDKCPKNKEKCEKFIKNPDYNVAVNIMFKNLGNSLYGKFGQKMLEYEYYGKEESLPDKDVDKVYDADNYIYHLYSYHGENYVNLKSKNYLDSKHTFTPIASFITAYARVKLLNSMKENENEMIYCDTDSKKIEHKKHSFVGGDDLGDFGFEYTKTQKFYAPKIYMDLDENDLKVKGVKKQKSKGSFYCPKGKLIISIKDIDTIRTNIITQINEIEGFRSFKSRSPIRFREAIKSNGKYEMAQWIDKAKQVWFYDDKREWYGDIYYGYGIQSRPYYINENLQKEMVNKKKIKQKVK